MKIIILFLISLIFHNQLMAGELFISVDQKSAMIVGEIHNQLVIQIQDLPQSINTLVLDSMGGRVDAAVKISEFIQNRSLNTHTKTLCYSACTLIFQAGRIRSSDPNVHFMYHKVKWYGPGSENLPKYQQLLNDKYIEYGLPASFVYSLTKVDKYFFAEELISLNIVNQIEYRSYDWETPSADMP